eukprot:211565-Alexandrium_andersonii.AAC.1
MDSIGGDVSANADQGPDHARPTLAGLAADHAADLASFLMVNKVFAERALPVRRQPSWRRMFDDIAPQADELADSIRAEPG